MKKHFLAILILALILTPKTALGGTLETHNYEEYLAALKANFAAQHKEFAIIARGLPETDIAKDLAYLFSDFDLLKYDWRYDPFGQNPGYVINFYADYAMDAVVYHAYATGDVSRMNEKETAVYIAAEQFLNAYITPGASDYEKALIIHDYLVLNMRYDAENAYRDPYGALILGSGVCDAYARTFKLLAKMSGLECDYVFGKAQAEHAWNRVKIDGEYYYADVTYDDPFPDVPGRLSRSYFYLTAEEMNKDHTPYLPF
jgi:transglutaminase-like putative cysteine protease